MEHYQEMFEELKSLMMLKNPLLNETYFISSFISGLREEIKPMVKMLSPTSLTKAFEIAQLQEQACKLHHQQLKPGGKHIIDNKFGLIKHPGTNVSNQYKVPSAPERMGSQGLLETKKLSPQEVQYRRNHGLCFKCGEKYGLGHQCKSKQLNLMSSEEEEDSTFEDALVELEEQEGNPGQVVEVSLNNLSGSLKRKTITLQGELVGYAVKILVDTGSSDSFLSHNVAKQLALLYYLAEPFTITMADGS